MLVEFKKFLCVSCLQAEITAEEWERNARQQEAQVLELQGELERNAQVTGI